MESGFWSSKERDEFRDRAKELGVTTKLYFLDVGLMCFLMGINKKHNILLHPEIGAIFETFIISELVKMRMHRGLPLNLFFWRDKLGKEIDCIIESGQQIVPLEIKSSQTINSSYFDNLMYWVKLAKSRKSDAIIIYGGKNSQKRSNGQIFSWRDITKLGQHHLLGS